MKNKHEQKITPMETFIKEKTTGEYTQEFANDISYRFYKMIDDWIAVVEMHQYRGMIPVAQAKNRQKALEYITFIEPITVPFDVI